MDQTAVFQVCFPDVGEGAPAAVGEAVEGHREPAQPRGVERGRQERGPRGPEVVPAQVQHARQPRVVHLEDRGQALAAPPADLVPTDVHRAQPAAAAAAAAA
eukprot:CAMPEP_0194685230 /NCGR_PEP_ID=MMETSP0295-20121207/14645_1 /TAXON_ID=39354 /ORGANISM="Heterosigma akashiwo, Strain CCMP2393" /LENGTH=101 /DNA_ID=CAMNT_0039572547 /DNA_START=307 /DNA_END=609 /DNA_ORIENTATION=-